MLLLRNSLLIGIVLILFSCPNNSELSNTGLEVYSPKTAWNYTEAEPIFFSLNVNSQEVTWESSLSGMLGTGNNIYLPLDKGEHTITWRFASFTDSITVSVQEALSGTTETTVLLNRPEISQNLGVGVWNPCIVTFGSTISAFSISHAEGRYTGVSSAAPKQENLSARNLVKQGLRFPLPFSSELSNLKTIAHSAHSRNLAQTGVPVGSKKTFFVMNTKNQFGAPHELLSELLYSSSVLDVWVTEKSVISSEKLSELVLKVESAILPRVQALWGQWVDVDQNGKLSLLLSSSINEEGLALGFFYPGDLFTKISDKNSSSYNPYSNEMDILYLAVPEDDPESPWAFSSVVATIAHECTHLITFTNKTWNKISGTQDFVPQEEIFLDEGWSHLSENLCGYGVSGGNIDFLNIFLQEPAYYSFAGNNIYNQDDSAGRRGAMTLFLSWLVWRQGGMQWDNENTTQLIDTGGIAFLQTMVNSDLIGWESIGNALGLSTDSLFREMVRDITLQNSSDNSFSYKTDPLTGEPVEVFPKMGEIVTAARTVLVPSIKSYAGINTTSLSVLNYSFLILDPLTIHNRQNITIKTLSSGSSAYASFFLSP